MAKKYLFIPLIFFHYFSDLLIISYMLIIGVSFILSDLNKKKFIFEIKNLLIFFLLIAYIALAFLLFNHQSFIFSTDNGGHLYYLILSVAFFLLIIYFNLTGQMEREELNIFFKYFFYISLFSIFIEAFIINALNYDPQIIPTYRDSIGYYSPNQFGYLRPFGLTGSSPANGCIMVMLMWINFINYKKIHFIYLAILAVLLTSSGTAYVCLAATLIIYFINFRHISFFSIFPLILVFIFFLYLYQIGYQKVQLDYFLYFFSVLRIQENIFSMNFYHILFGGLGNYQEIFNSENFLTEWYFVYAISRYGILMTLGVWIYLFSKIYFNKYSIVFLSIFIGCLHVPTIFYAPAIIILALITENKSLFSTKIQ